MSAKISEQITTVPVESSSPGKDIENARGKDDSQEQESREELEAQTTSLGIIVQSFAIVGAFHI